MRMDDDSHCEEWVLRRSNLACLRMEIASLESRRSVAL
jgi:hypothetical protein